MNFELWEKMEREGMLVNEWLWKRDLISTSEAR